jgi:hypothetical protein
MDFGCTYSSILSNLHNIWINIVDVFDSIQPDHRTAAEIVLSCTIIIVVIILTAYHITIKKIDHMGQEVVEEISNQLEAHVDSHDHKHETYQEKKWRHRSLFKTVPPIAVDKPDKSLPAAHVTRTQSGCPKHVEIKTLYKAMASEEETSSVGLAAKEPQTPGKTSHKPRRKLLDHRTYSDVISVEGSSSASSSNE